MAFPFPAPSSSVLATICTRDNKRRAPCVCGCRKRPWGQRGRRTPRQSSERGAKPRRSRLRPSSTNVDDHREPALLADRSVGRQRKTEAGAGPEGCGSRPGPLRPGEEEELRPPPTCSAPGPRAFRQDLPRGMVEDPLAHANGSSNASPVAASTPGASASASAATSGTAAAGAGAGTSRRSASTTSAPTSASARSKDATGS